ncbi:hypothetical protein RIF29_25501 [Crotalaria pallida]|uniref:Uncharacterized protein n=1 Tax=Crotalaria pallida TaxID=3830 RepID=A0AAN9I4A4_CROPI
MQIHKRNTGTSIVYSGYFSLYMILLMDFFPFSIAFMAFGPFSFPSLLFSVIFIILYTLVLFLLQRTNWSR